MAQGSDSIYGTSRLVFLARSLLPEMLGPRRRSRPAILGTLDRTDFSIPRRFVRVQWEDSFRETRRLFPQKTSF